MEVLSFFSHGLGEAINVRGSVLVFELGVPADVRSAGAGRLQDSVPC